MSKSGGDTWNVTELYETGMYFYKILFDEENPAILYASGLDRKHDANDTVRVYRSTDTGNSWHLAYNEKLNESCGGVYDMVKYKNKLIFYTKNCGLFELDLEATPALSNQTIKYFPELTIFLNSEQKVLQFKTDVIIESVEIIDFTGRLLQKTISKGKPQVDISRLNSGIYLVSFYSKNQRITKKIHIIK